MAEAEKNKCLEKAKIKFVFLTGETGAKRERKIHLDATVSERKRIPIKKKEKAKLGTAEFYKLESQ